MGDIATGAWMLSDLELAVMDSAIASAPAFPNPDGTGTGIAHTLDNPAACKIITELEYILMSGGCGP